MKLKENDEEGIKVKTLERIKYLKIYDDNDKRKN